MTNTNRGVLLNESFDGLSYAANQKWHAHLLDQYRLYVEMADRVSTRRAATNSYFLSVNTAILAFVSYLTSNNGTRYLWLMALAGVTLCLLWEALIRSYKKLNTAKFVVIHEIEKHLPTTPYTAEWEAMGRGLDRKKYQPMTRIERGVPFVFVCMHLTVLYQKFPFGGY